MAVDRSPLGIFENLNAEFLEVSRQTSLVAEVPNRYFGSRVTTRAELNDIVQYCWPLAIEDLQGLITGLCPAQLASKPPECSIT
jgi:hypothetical protein